MEKFGRRLFLGALSALGLLPLLKKPEAPPEVVAQPLRLDCPLYVLERVNTAWAPFGCGVLPRVEGKNEARLTLQIIGPYGPLPYSVHVFIKKTSTQAQVNAAWDEMGNAMATAVLYQGSPYGASFANFQHSHESRKV